jgi:hypothetical protein
MFAWIYLASYLVAVGSAAFFPKPHQRDCEASAKARGWSTPMIMLTRSTGFFTLYGQLWLVIAEFTGNRSAFCVALVIETTVMVLYHTLVAIDPSLLAHDDNKDLVRKVTRVLPPMDIHAAIWLGLHLQHTVCPLHLWLKDHPPTIYYADQDVNLSLAAFLVYVVWNTFCWVVQGKPTYPIQKQVWDRGWQVYCQATVACMMLVVIISFFCDLLF